MGPEATGNELVDRLPAPARADFLRDAQKVSLASHEELVAQGAELRSAYFPTTAVCSMILSLRSGQRAEIATVGNEGFVGLPIVLGKRPSPEYAVVQVAGQAYKLTAERLKLLKEQHKSFAAALLDYIGYAFQMAKQSTACNAYHTIEQRLARWLLIAHDRARRDEFRLTQDLLAHMAAGTRPRVSEAAGRLRAAGIIDYRKSVLRIKDRKRLEAKACECYGATDQRRSTAR